jgi:lysophospholipase L1-like esterase
LIMKLKTILRRILRIGATLAGVLLLLEALCFGVILVSNYLIYGKPHELATIKYNPATIFIRENIPRPTRHNRTAPDPADNRLIWFFGGSTTMSDTRDHALTLPSLVVSELNKAQERISFSAVNFGMSAFNSLQEAHFLQQMLAQRGDRPDLVIFYDGANDAGYLSQYRDIRGHFGFRRVRALVESQAKGFLGLFRPINAYLKSSFIKELYDKINQVMIPLKEDSDLLSEYGLSLEKRYDHIQESVMARGGRFMLFLQPIRHLEEKHPSSQKRSAGGGLLERLSGLTVYGHNTRVVYRGIRDRLAGKEYFRDISDCLDSGKGTLYKADGVHVTDQGRREVAVVMSRIIQEKTGIGAP